MAKLSLLLTNDGIQFLVLLDALPMSQYKLSNCQCKHHNPVSIHNPVNHSLKSCWGSFHAKRHDLILPYGDTNANNSFALSVRSTCHYPYKRSWVVTYLALPVLSMQSSILGRGKELDFVTAFSFLKSVQKQ